MHNSLFIGYPYCRYSHSVKLFSRRLYTIYNLSLPFLTTYILQAVFAAPAIFKNYYFSDAAERALLFTVEGLMKIVLIPVFVFSKHSSFAAAVFTGSAFSALHSLFKKTTLK